MSVEIFWQLPARGDGRFGDGRVRLRGERGASERFGSIKPGSGVEQSVSDPRGSAFNYFDYLHQVARAAELATFDGVRIQHDPRGDESWIIAGYVARGTRKLTLLTEFEASWGSAVYAAKNAVSVQRYTGGRFAWQLSAGGSASERLSNGDSVPDAHVVPRIEEFITVARGVIGTAPYSFKGEFFEVLNGGFKGTLANHPAPPVYLSGETDEALDLSARSADVHVFNVAPRELLAERIAEVKVRERRQASERKRAELEFGVRVDLVARETTDEARRDAERYARQVGVTTTFHAEHGLWKGLSTRATGAEATLVGSYEELAAQLAGYVELGVGHLLLSAVPHLEEAYRIGTHVLPLVRRSLARAAA